MQLCGFSVSCPNCAYRRPAIEYSSYLVFMKILDLFMGVYLYSICTCLRIHIHLCNCVASQPQPAVGVVHVDAGQFVAQDWPSLPSVYHPNFYLFKSDLIAINIFDFRKADK